MAKAAKVITTDTDGRDEIAFPAVDDPKAYALEISGESMAPVYRDGDLVVVSPAAEVRKGDRVVLKTVSGEYIAKQVRRLARNRVVLDSLNPAFPERIIPTTDIAWMHRIIWASQ